MAFKLALSALVFVPQVTWARAFLNTTSPVNPPAQRTSTQSHHPAPLSIHKDDTVVCSFSTAANDGNTCQSFSSEWGLTVDQFENLNPGVSCPDLVGGKEYCVVGDVCSSPSTTTTSSSDTRTSPPTKTTPKTTMKTTSSAEHEPQQSGLADNCDDFYLVQGGDSCQIIESKYGITAAQFGKWNPSINSDCTNLLAGYYVCVRVPGAKTATPTKTTTKPGNGISTPTPTQSGIASNCNKFDLVQPGDSCSGISTKYGIPLAKFYDWNPAVGKSCGSLLSGYYVCVDVVGYKPPTKTTSKGNGITTPTPYEPGMVGNCNRFYKVKKGDTCAKIASSQKVTVKNIEKWNPKVGSQCTGLYLNYFICTGVK